MTVLLDDGDGSALSGIGSRLRGVAARTLGLMLALCLGGLTGLLAFDIVAVALGCAAGGGLIRSRAIVYAALKRAGLRGQRLRSLSSAMRQIDNQALACATPDRQSEVGRMKPARLSARE